MPIDFAEVIQIAAQFAHANGYLIVPSLEGATWDGGDAPRPAAFGNAGVIDGECFVRFDELPPPGVLAVCPGDFCVLVAADGTCRFDSLL